MTCIDIQDNRRIVELLHNGNERCFDSLFRRYYKPLCAYASRFVPADRAEEIVQDTLLWLWESRERLLPEMSVRSLLFTIVKNKSLNSITRNTIRSRVIRELAERFREEFDDPELYLGNELSEKIIAALEKVPPEFRKTFHMHRLEGMSHKEIAAALGVSPQTVNYRIGQTVRILRAELKEYWPIVLLFLPPGRIF